MNTNPTPTVTEPSTTSPGTGSDATLPSTEPGTTSSRIGTDGKPTTLKQQFIAGFNFRNFSKTILIMVLAGVTVAFLFGGISGGGKTPILDSLKNPEFARGLITFIVAIGTILIALLLTVSNILGEENAKDEETAGKERFNRGKEVLTILVGILGTIIGFYYGSTDGKNPEDEIQKTKRTQIPSSNVNPEKLESAEKLKPTSYKIDEKSPYPYLITFNDSRTRI